MFVLLVCAGLVRNSNILSGVLLLLVGDDLITVFAVVPVSILFATVVVLIAVLVPVKVVFGKLWFRVDIL